MIRKTNNESNESGQSPCFRSPDEHWDNPEFKVWAYDQGIRAVDGPSHVMRKRNGDGYAVTCSTASDNRDVSVLTAWKMHFPHTVVARTKGEGKDTLFIRTYRKEDAQAFLDMLQATQDALKVVLEQMDRKRQAE